jgi:signal transduction histidine kinase
MKGLPSSPGLGDDGSAAPDGSDTTAGEAPSAASGRAAEAAGPDPERFGEGEDTHHPAPDSASEVRFPLPDLRIAVERVIQRWREASPHDEGREHELADHLFEVADAVAGVGRGESPTDLQEGVVLRRRLLELLRSELVAVWSDPSEGPPPKHEHITARLRALDHVQRLLVPRWDEEFGVALEGPSGLELAVEVAHDFRSPLSSVLFLADTLRSGGSGRLNELQLRQLNLIYSAALSMVSMAGDVVDLGRGAQPMGEREPTRFSVSEVMDSVRGMVEPMVESKGLSLSVRPPEGDLRLGYPEALRRSLLNLTTNAVKFTADGFVELSGRAKGPVDVQFSVRDTGPGINPGAAEDLYLPFRPFQGHSGFHFSGTGLGLTIVRKLVRAMEGELRYETQRSLGTRFYFTIPLQPVDPL